MDKQYRTYTEEFKREALELLKSSGKSAARIERELGITKGLLLKWRTRYQVRRTNGEERLAVPATYLVRGDLFPVPSIIPA